MRLALSILRTPAIVVVLMVGLCVALSAYGFMSWGTPKVRSVIDQMVDQYDSYFPEITIVRGQASIKKPQPYYVDFGQGKNAPIIIDTREGFENEALGYLEKAREGFVLTRNSLVVKNKGQLRIVPLAEMPDFVLNADSLRALVERFVPTVIAVVAVLVVIYFLFAKSFQVLVLALIPFVWAKVGKVTLSYGQAVKISAFSMVPPVALMGLQDLFGAPAGGKLVYFGLYLVLLIVLSAMVSRSLRSETEPYGGITP
jgi:hypothetical protein